MEITADDESRFWEKVERDDECWGWNAATRAGYGVLKVNGTATSAHRISYHIHNGGIPDGKLVLHTCDNRICTNPDHLYAGTYSDNTQDHIERGGWDPAESGPVGEEAGGSVLTETDVRKIRVRYDDGETQTAIAEDYPVRQQHISDIVNGRKWKHLE